MVRWHFQLLAAEVQYIDLGQYGDGCQFYCLCWGTAPKTPSKATLAQRFTTLLSHPSHAIIVMGLYGCVVSQRGVISSRSDRQEPPFWTRSYFTCTPSKVYVNPITNKKIEVSHLTAYPCMCDTQAAGWSGWPSRMVMNLYIIFRIPFKRKMITWQLVSVFTNFYLQLSNKALHRPQVTYSV